MDRVTKNTAEASSPSYLERANTCRLHAARSCDATARVRWLEAERFWLALAERGEDPQKVLHSLRRVNDRPLYPPFSGLPNFIRRQLLAQSGPLDRWPPRSASNPKTEVGNMLGACFRKLDHLLLRKRVLRVIA
jgi:hypothetical protein